MTSLRISAVLLRLKSDQRARLRGYFSNLLSQNIDTELLKWNQVLLGSQCVVAEEDPDMDTPLVADSLESEMLCLVCKCLCPPVNE